ncbi:DNA/RNA helicase domain-containing protein [uncultured Clostridium sp.]|uniref:DNA/RNA helicase domain-containing protein n=1 Tax=uncultured Clostridium sp. TaxID=59620 RepID=UPI0028E576E7|nr:DNA/RNA helicase domain-containing protein [uncultured Clostridium sp.]
MFEILEYNFDEDIEDKNDYLDKWPMLYILKNNNQAYIGQSTSIVNRMKQHKANPEKDIFDKVNTIYSKEFNQSVTFDYESKLIQLFFGDNNFIITNKNNGLSDCNYFNKEHYDDKFKELWSELREKKLAKHSINQIENSDLFKYSPYKKLTKDQHKAVNTILNILMENTYTTINVTGMPGSGKTIAGIFLFKCLRELEEFKDKKIGFVIPQTSLRKTMKQIFKNTYNLQAKDIIGPSDVVGKEYDMLIVDEAHRLHKRKNITNYKSHDDNNKKLGLGKDGDELDWILHSSGRQILFYDENQVIGPSGIDIKSLEGKKDFKDLSFINLSLTSQMRVKGGLDYINFIRSLLQGKLTSKKTFTNYEFILFKSFEKFDKKMREKESECGLSRMVAGYAWQWKSNKNKNAFDIEIENINKRWNSKTENWVNLEGAIDEVGCIHSIQGYDLNYAAVIIGNDLKYDKDNNCIVVDPGSYYDQKGKATATIEELTEYIINIYYVLMTRGIKGTYIYVCDENLREYFAKFVQVQD